MKYLIKNNRLEVRLETPEEGYKGSRFDRMGMITEVILDNRHTFGARESLIEGQGSGGQGFFNEFGIKEPIGYDEINVGEQFLKIGVGVLTKESSEAYDYFHTYSVEAIDYEVIEEASKISFVSESKNINGYAYKYTKTITLVESEMFVDYTVVNTGEKVINTTEYCHNFVAVNNNIIGPHYNLQFSYPVDVDLTVGLFQTGEDNIYWDRFVEEEFYLTLKNFSKEKDQYFEVVHKPSGVGFRETSNFELERVAVWGKTNVVSPEAFIKIDLASNESKSWQRLLNFFNGK